MIEIDRDVYPLLIVYIFAQNTHQTFCHSCNLHNWHVKYSVLLVLPFPLSEVGVLNQHWKTWNSFTTNNYQIMKKASKIMDGISILLALAFLGSTQSKNCRFRANEDCNCYPENMLFLIDFLMCLFDRFSSKPLWRRKSLYSPQSSMAWNGLCKNSIGKYLR